MKLTETFLMDSDGEKTIQNFQIWSMEMFSFGIMNF